MKIVLVPIDERPCNHYYPQILPLDEEVKIVVPPYELMSKRKTVCDVSKVSKWLLEETKDADYACISLDTLCYGGIIPSRIHHEKLEDILKRSDVIREIRNQNPKIKIFVNELIMRCPAYSNAFEEPDYFDDCGREINRIGVYMDKERCGILTEEEKSEYAQLRENVKKEYLDDLLTRRAINKQAIIYNLSLAKDGIIDFFSIPQDDCAPYGYTHMDVTEIKNYIDENKLENVMMYPGADEVGLDLISRAICDYFAYSPRVFINYADSNAMDKIPEFEDRPVDLTINLHIQVAGCRRVNSLTEADIVYLINCGSEFLDSTHPDKLKSLENRDILKNQNIINVAKSESKVVCIADIAYTNEGDLFVLTKLQEKKIFNKVDAYAGWNTCSNTLGTATCDAICNFFFKNTAKAHYFLISRYIEDFLYMGIARKELIKYIKEKNDPKTTIDNFGAYEKEYENFVKNRLLELVDKYNLRSICDFKDIEVTFPWHRTFEIFLKVVA